MIDLDTSAWARIGETTNTEYFVIEPGIVAVVPRKGAIDVFETAQENVNFVNEHGRREGRPVVMVVFFDRLAAQDSSARKVYSAGPDPTAVCGGAMLGGGLLGRAVASVFLAIVKPKVVFRMFGAYDEALAWARSLHAAQRPTSNPPSAVPTHDQDRRRA